MHRISIKEVEKAKGLNDSCLVHALCEFVMASPCHVCRLVYSFKSFSKIVTHLLSSKILNGNYRTNGNVIAVWGKHNRGWGCFGVV